MKVNLRKLGLGLVAILVTTSLAFAYRGSSRARYDAARRDFEEDCSRWRSAGGSGSVCDPGARVPSLIPRLRDGQARVASASRALASGDHVAAERELAAAFDTVAELDRIGSEVPTVMAASLLRQALNVIETEVPPTPSGQALAARVLARRHLYSVAHPLRGRLLFATRNVLDDFDRPLLRALAVQTIDQEERMTAAMERAITLGDTDGCIRAAKSRSKLAARYTEMTPDVICPELVKAAQTSKRLDRLRRAARSGSRMQTALR